VCAKVVIELAQKKKKDMKFDFLQKQTSRRNILRGSITLAGSAFLAHLFPRTLLRSEPRARIAFPGRTAREYAR
jgi:hypothetical protein